MVLSSNCTLGNSTCNKIISFATCRLNIGGQNQRQYSIFHIFLKTNFIIYTE